MPVLSTKCARQKDGLIRNTLPSRPIPGMVAEHAASVRIKSIAIPVHWILKDGAEWSPAYDKARKDEMILCFHSGAFMVWLCSPPHPFFELTFVIDGYRHPSHPTAPVPKGCSNVPPFSPGYCRSTIDSVPGLLENGGTHSH